MTGLPVERDRAKDKDNLDILTVRHHSTKLDASYL